jgi:predicted alpha/beta-hydrolase family hydrolase
MESVERFEDTLRVPAVRGFLHRPEVPCGRALVLTHGAGGNCAAPLLVALATSFADAGYTVLRCDLPFRQKRPSGPPLGSSAEDRAGLRNAVAAMKTLVNGPVFLGGHSYGGRQASMLAADDPEIASGLLLLSYPLHPPRNPAQLRTAHFPSLRTPALFVHGSRDPFGTETELREAIELIPAKTTLLMIEGAGHDLSFSRRKTGSADGLPEQIFATFAECFGRAERTALV